MKVYIFLRFAAIKGVETGLVYVGREGGNKGVEVVEEEEGVKEITRGLAAFFRD